MTVQEVSKKVMKESKTTQQMIADAVGLASPSGVANWLSGKSMRVDNLVRLLDVCGYDLIAVSRSGESGSYRISNEEGEDVVDMRGSTPVEDGEEARLRAIIAEELRSRGL